ncbi:MAG: DUF4339 domain-containing protein, partial [Myxococcales bacterium]|nr:DUF4339 domain-containing protein [Myxococcales bacterium]
MATASAYVAPGQPDPAAEPIWHVVVAGDQQGPYAPAQLGEMMTVGTIDWEAYVWREGFDGWVPARDIPELVEAITGQPYDPSYSSAAGDGDFAQPAAHAAAAADPFGDMEAGGAFDGTNVAASPFADGFGDDFGGNDDFGARHDSQQPTMAVSSEEIGGFGASPDVAMRAANSNAGGDLFGGGRNDMGAAFGGGAAPTSMPDQTSMTGQRNENSVLFSLANLQALATESSSASVRPEAKAGHAQGDGSGLIDIRALAAATGMGASAPAPALGGVPSFSAGPASERPKEDQLDNLMSIGTGSPLAMGALGAPVLTPAKDDSKKLIYVIAALGAALLLVVGVGVVYLMTRDSGTEVAAAAPPIAPPTNAGAEGTAATAGAAPAEATGGAAAPSAAA